MTATVLDLFPGQVRVTVDASLTQPRQLSRWERFWVRLERLADKADLAWPFQRTRTTEPFSRFVLLGDRLACHPAQFEALMARIAEGAPAVVPVTAGRYRFDAELGGETRAEKPQARSASGVVAAIVALVLFAAVPVLAVDFVLPAGATTDCGPSGGRVAIRPEVVFRGDSSPLDIERGRARWGACFAGNQAPGCSDLGGRCIVGESDERQFFEWWSACGPGAARVPTAQEIHDAGLAFVGGRPLIEILQAQRLAGCATGDTEGGGLFSRRCPAGTACRPAPTPCPACPPPPECPAPPRPRDAWVHLPELPTEGTALVFWSQLGGVRAFEHRGIYRAGLWLTRGGGLLPSCPAPGPCVFAWRGELAPPEVRS